jgi:hypothetical protein
MCRSCPGAILLQRQLQYKDIQIAIKMITNGKKKRFKNRKGGFPMSEKVTIYGKAG